MTAELVSVTAPAGLPGTLADQGYSLPAGLAYGAWETAGLSLRFMHRNINWWVGDWMLYGEAAYGQEAYQATVDSLTAVLGREADTLGQCAWVASRYPPAMRIAGLSWSHHRAVLLEGLQPAAGRALLADAVANTWTVAELVDQAAALAVTIDAQTAPQAPDTAPGEIEAPDVSVAPWVPTVADLTPAARQALQYHAARTRVQPQAAGRVWCAALFWGGVKDAFLPERWRD